MNSAEAKEAKEAEQAAHYALIEQLDIHSIHKSFRNPAWRPNQRRNKNIKTILGDASRREASLAATPMDNGSGAATPNDAATGRDDEKDDGLSTSGTSTPANEASSTPGGPNGSASSQPNLAQASRSLSKLVLEKSLRPNGAGMTTGGLSGGAGAPSATYTNIESAPSLAPQKRYCDVTGLPAPYQDPKTRLRYHDKEVFAMIRGLPQGYAEQYLEARGAHTVLK
ncbi:hypothetical protein N8I77_000434 [Diaporthe amygdali]|uniref:Vps72/YL1 C-terminal domain-containing protein n=1 Tax=Phomopsis amygdali TaxID=1214568 RepID=A0AAD9SNT3_PHOAM|nr:hypothetical protein N8I77_000434 [Diaporthe amygdali]